MDEKKATMKIQNINLGEIIVCAMFHWRSIIIVAMCGAVTLCGLSYVNSVLKAQKEKTQWEEKQNYRNSMSNEEYGDTILNTLSDKQISNVEETIYNEKQYYLKKDYQKNSDLMQADAYHIYEMNLIYQIEIMDSQNVSDVEELYESLISSGELNNLIVENTGLYYGDNYVSLSEEKSTKELKNGVIYLNILFVDENMRDTIENVVNQYIEQENLNVSRNTGGQCSAKLIGESISQQPNERILVLQEELQNSIIELRSSITKSVKDFSTEEQEYYQYLRSKENENSSITQTYNMTSPKIDITFGLFGAFLFAFAYFTLWCIKYASNNTISIKDDLNKIYEIPQLGRIINTQKNIKIFSFVDRWLEKIYYMDDGIDNSGMTLEYLTFRLTSLLGANRVDELFLVGSNMGDYTKLVCQKLKKELKNVKVIVVEDILNNVDSLKAIQNAQNVILVETIEKTLYGEVYKEIQLLKEENIVILGGITIKN